MSQRCCQLNVCVCVCVCVVCVCVVHSHPHLFLVSLRRWLPFWHHPYCFGFTELARYPYGHDLPDFTAELLVRIFGFGDRNAHVLFIASAQEFSVCMCVCVNLVSFRPLWGIRHYSKILSARYKKNVSVSISKTKNSN